MRRRGIGAGEGVEEDQGRMFLIGRILVQEKKT